MRRLTFIILLALTGCPGPEATWRDEYIIDNCLRCKECCMIITPEDEGETDD